MPLRDKHLQAIEAPEQASARLTLQYQKAIRENPFYQAFVHFVSSPDLTGKGELQGLSYAVKDIAAVQGLPTTLGLSRHGQAAALESSRVVRLLQGHGAALFGTTELDALCLDHYGRGRNGKLKNPRAPDYCPLGSSCGSAVAVARSQVDFALGSDFGGSVRLPAAACGICGLKLSAGLLPLEGIFTLSSNLDSLGYLTRTLEDLNFLLQVIHPEIVSASMLQAIFVPADSDLAVLPDEERKLFARVLDSAAHLTDIRVLPEELSFGRALAARKIIAVESACEAVAGLGLAEKEVPPIMRALRTYLDSLAVAERASARCVQQEFEAGCSTLLDGATAFLAPTLGARVPRWTEVESPHYKESTPLNYFAALANLCNLPALTFSLEPVSSDGISFAVQLLGKPVQERELVALASRLSRASSG